MRSGVTSTCTCGMAASRSGMPERCSCVSMRIRIGAGGCFGIAGVSFLVFQNCKHFVVASAFPALPDRGFQRLQPILLAVIVLLIDIPVGISARQPG